MQQKKDPIEFLGFCVAIYVVVIAITVIMYPISQGILKPLMSNIFPVMANAPIGKTIFAITAVYWGGAIIYWSMAQNKPSNPR